MNARAPRSRSSVHSKILSLQSRYGLSDDCVRMLEVLLEQLKVDRYVYTTVKRGELAVDTHVADSLSGLLIEELKTAKMVADIGSGAGFPGLPLAIAAPDTCYELLEASGRKLDFAENIRDLLAIENVELIADRAELWAASNGALLYQAALSRAVSSLPIMLEYAAPLLEGGGIFIAWKGSRDTEEELQAARAAEALGMEVERVLPVEPYPGSKNRHLHLYRKVSETPDRYPRRAGMAVKRPLGQD